MTSSVSKRVREVFSVNAGKFGAIGTFHLADQLDRSVHLAQAGRVLRSFANRHVIRPPRSSAWFKFRAVKRLGFRGRGIGQ